MPPHRRKQRRTDMGGMWCAAADSHSRGLWVGLVGSEQGEGLFDCQPVTPRSLSGCGDEAGTDSEGEDCECSHLVSFVVVVRSRYHRRAAVCKTTHIGGTGLHVAV